MPHFSPIMWLMTGFSFYLVLLFFVVVFWWMQGFLFPSMNLVGSKVLLSDWDWS